MQTIHPLPKTHPEFSILKCSQFIEYRVAQSHVTWRRALVPAALSLFLLCWSLRWTELSIARCAGAIAILFLIVRTTVSNVIAESIILFPKHGIQLETHCGFMSHVLSTTRHFIPFSIYDDLVINEALFGWNVRYYIVAMTSQSGVPALRVAFPNILPHLPVLRHIYSDIYATLPRRPLLHTDPHTNGTPDIR